MALALGRDCNQDLDFRGLHMAGKPTLSRWDVSCKNGFICSVEESKDSQSIHDLDVGFLTPSFCHPHIHLDKCFLLSHPKYADLEMKTGDFAEALKLTNQAKSRFEHDDLMERGRALIAESINFGVTHIRAFVEVDLVVGMKCLEAGLALKEEFINQCYIQICVFAQDPIISYRDRGAEMMALLEDAIKRPGVEAIGSTPYVEKDGGDAMTMNMAWTIERAKQYKLHLDFHIDYNLDSSKTSSILEALRLLNILRWPSDTESSDFRTIVFGHCTRLTLFDTSEWLNLIEKVQGLPVSFVGLPNSDLFMMGRASEESGGGQMPRGTLQVVQMVHRYGLNAVIGINNVGNAFTPQGSCDPLSLASFGIGIYQAGTKADTDVLMQCISTRAKSAIGLTISRPSDLELKAGDPADLVVFGKRFGSGSRTFRVRKTTQELMLDPSHDRITVFGGEVTSR